MTIIATVARAVLAIEQKVQGLVAVHARATCHRNFDKAIQLDTEALADAEDCTLSLEQHRAKKAAALHEAYRASLIKLHEGVDASIELVHQRKLQAHAAANQRRAAAGTWLQTEIKADKAAEAARKAAEQLG